MRSRSFVPSGVISFGSSLSSVSSAGRRRVRVHLLVDHRLQQLALDRRAVVGVLGLDRVVLGVVHVVDPGVGGGRVLAPTGMAYASTQNSPPSSATTYSAGFLAATAAPSPFQPSDITALPLDQHLLVLGRGDREQVRLEVDQLLLRLLELGLVLELYE